MNYSEEEAVTRLQQLDNSQQSVESTSKWFLAVKDMAKELVKLWFKEFRKASPKKKIAFLHLVNDVIQNGVTVAPQFGKLFEPVLPTAFKETAKVQRHSVRASVAHLLIVWASRHIYSKSFLRQLRFICQRAVAEADAPDASEEAKKNIIAASPFAFSFTSVMMGVTPVQPKSATTGPRHKRRKSSKNTTSFVPTSLTPVDFSPVGLGMDPTRTSISAFREELTRELQTEAITPPQTSDLLELLEKFQQPTASGDAATRRAIAQFPPEVSDANKAVEIITNASESERHELVRRIAECANQLNKYNEQLEEESIQRHKLSLNLHAYHAQLKSRAKDYESELRDLKEKLAHGLALKQELTNHMSSLPDLNLLPDMTVGLDPLPTVGDLFG